MNMWIDGQDQGACDTCDAPLARNNIINAVHLEAQLLKKVLLYSKWSFK